MYDRKYKEQVNIVLHCLALLPQIDPFVLKGGTAINMFIRDMPRLSVDIDLTYYPMRNRAQAIVDIQRSLLLYKQLIENQLGLKVREVRSKVDNLLIKLVVYNNEADIKIEPNLVLRGTLFPVEKRNLVQLAQDEFKLTLENIPVLSLAEVYAGKLCAALDRQHPRDLFDVKYLYDHEGITDKIRQAFIIYLASNSRPMYELLAPSLIDIQDRYDKEFAGMELSIVTCDELLSIREKLITDINNGLTDKEKAFLISIKKGQPEWDLMPFEHLDQLPAIKWKLINIKKIAKAKHSAMLNKLEEVLAT